MIRIWHNVNLRMDTPSTFADSHALVATINTDNLDDAYGRSQHLDSPWFMGAGITRHADADRIRSTSVGDVLEHADGPLNGALFFVKNVGFKRIDPLEVFTWKTAYDEVA